MLSSAHVLAIDAKNLLDVVDGIRIRYPHVNSHIVRGGGSSSSNSSGGLSHNANTDSDTGSSSAASSLEKRQQQQPPHQRPTQSPVVGGPFAARASPSGPQQQRTH